MTADEKEVREAWELVHCCDGSYRDYHRGTVLVQQGVTGHWLGFEAWSAAAAFTRERKRQIAEVEEEIAETTKMVSVSLAFLNVRIDTTVAANEILIWNRVLAREQAALEELKRGMR